MYTYCAGAQKRWLACQGLAARPCEFGAVLSGAGFCTSTMRGMRLHETVFADNTLP